MKNISDLIQILLSQSGMLNFAAGIVVFICLWLLYRYLAAALSFALKAIRKPFIPMRWQSVFFVLFGGMVVSLCSRHIRDGLQLAEQYIYPTYIDSDTSSYVVGLYELKMSKMLSDAEMQVVKKRTMEMAEKISSSPLSIYEVAYSECGMNPFEIRADGIAAGWIQFTRAGLVGLGYSLDQVKTACKNRDINLIMDLTESYLIDRSKGVKMPRPVDVYTCVFAPGFLTFGYDQTLYSIADGDAYFKNAVFDGYYTVKRKGKAMILNTEKAKDGKITKRELGLHLELKKAMLINSYESGI